MNIKHLKLRFIEAIKTPTTLVIGTFDGVHRGHLKLLEKAKETGNDIAVLLIYTTKQVFKEHQKTGVLTSLEDRVNMFKKHGVSSIYFLNIENEVALLSPSEFIFHILFPLGPKAVIIGEDFRFGRKAAGDTRFLRDYCGQLFELIIVEPLLEGNEVISTTLIKQKLQEGKMKEAKNMLGYYYGLTGFVVKGYGLGNKLGFPTANINLDPHYFLPRFGVYLVEVTYEDKKYYGMANLGFHPTVNEISMPLLEVNIFDFEGDIYHKVLAVKFLNHLRDEEKLPNIESLIAKIEEDRIKCVKLIEEGDF
ncbi:MAG: riboflavin biosynthesis protein RibF [Bacilli bacterium]